MVQTEWWRTLHEDRPHRTEKKNEEKEKVKCLQLHSCDEVLTLPHCWISDIFCNQKRCDVFTGNNRATWQSVTVPVRWWTSFWMYHCLYTLLDVLLFLWLGCLLPHLVILLHRGGVWGYQRALWIYESCAVVKLAVMFLIEIVEKIVIFSRTWQGSAAFTVC